MTKQLVRFGTAVMTTLLALVALWQFRVVVVHVLLSLALAAALRPLAERLVGRSFVVRAAWLLLYLAILGGFGFLLFSTGETVINEIQQLSGTVSVQDAWRLPLWLEGSAFQHVLVARLPPPSLLFEAVTGDQGQLVLPAVLGFTQGLGGVVSGTLIVLLLSLYWSSNHMHFERLWLSLLPSALRKQVRGIWRATESDLGGYLRGQVIHSVLAGLLLGLGYWLLGSSYPALLALAGALASLVPVVGAPLAVISPLLVGLLTSVQLSLFTVLYALVALIGLGVWVKPRLFNRKWDNPLLTGVLLIALADAFGLVGIIVAPPLSVVCQILWGRLVSHPDASGAAAEISDLKERLALVQAIAEVMDEPPPPLVTSSIERLTELLEKADPILQVESSYQQAEVPAYGASITAEGEPPRVP
ncbi:MAG: AI-2E family transporter [Anaerolineae bacterium]|nr:AI-2E family transporter [Anaerolineae bacterium]